VVAASLSSGVDLVSGKGLPEALSGAQVVIDVSNSPSFEDGAVLDFFEKATRNLLEAGKAAGIEHHVALSVVGAQRLPGSGYMRAKTVQEERIRTSGLPYTIVQSTQFFEFLAPIADAGTVGRSVRVSPALVQPIAADDVADILTDVALAAPANARLEIAGPEPLRLVDAVGRLLRANRDPREVVADAEATYFGLKINDASLMPASSPRLGATRFEKWIAGL
jgi:uncharacterized protein YbjT (DUF2867 family)